MYRGRTRDGQRASPNAPRDDSAVLPAWAQGINEALVHNAALALAACHDAPVPPMEPAAPPGMAGQVVISTQLNVGGNLTDAGTVRSEIREDGTTGEITQLSIKPAQAPEALMAEARRIAPRLFTVKSEDRQGSGGHGNARPLLRVRPERGAMRRGFGRAMRGNVGGRDENVEWIAAPENLTPPTGFIAYPLPRPATGRSGRARGAFVAI